MSGDNGNRPRFEMSFTLGGMIQLVVIIVGGLWALHTVDVTFAERMTRVETKVDTLKEAVGEIKADTARELGAMWRAISGKADRTGSERSQ